MKELQDLYRMDEEQWRAANIRLLEEGRLSEIDAANIAACLAEMSKSEDRTFRSLVSLILRHKLNIDFSGDTDNFRHWAVEIRGWQRQLKDFTSSNWIRKYILWVESCYKDGAIDAQDEYPGSTYPSKNPYSIVDVYGFDPT